MMTSSMRINPTLQPVGAIRLKMISTIIVNAAWPAMNDATSGTNAEPNATTGSSTHMTTGSTPTSSMTTTPNTNPIAVPITARKTRVPVVSALLRSTDMAPSTTQKPFSQREQVGDGDGQRQAETGAQTVAQHHRPGRQKSLGDRRDRGRLRHHPVGGSGLRQPAAEERAPTPDGRRRGGIADDATGHPDGGRKGATAQQLAADVDGGGVIGLTEYLDDVLAVATFCDGPQFSQCRS